MINLISGSLHAVLREIVEEGESQRVSHVRVEASWLSTLTGAGDTRIVITARSNTVRVREARSQRRRAEHTLKKAH